MNRCVETTVRRSARMALVLATLVLVACGPNVVSVQPLRVFPRPIVAPFPADIAISYPQEFSEFKYVEERPESRGGDWDITLGPTQVQVFDLVFSSMFRSVKKLEGLEPPADSGITAVFVPKVEEFQFALPTDTKIKVFEIWIKYQIAIYDKAGNEVMVWPFTAYGKTPTAFLKSDTDAINAASMVALRDAGASMVSGFQRDTKLKDWLTDETTALAKASAVQVQETVPAETEEEP